MFSVDTSVFRMGRCGGMALAPLLAWLACAGAAGAAWGAGAGCGVAQFACRGGGCVRADAYCDGAAQCADGSDEPPRCSPCNRTYYGRAGVAYALAVRPPQPPTLPLLCHLTFTAGGGAHGDLVQLAFEEFRVGRYAAGSREACADGYMQVAELGRPFTGGSWCGEAAGAALYYSETATVTVSVKLFRARLGEPFAFRLRYKFIQQREAVVRFGLAEAPLERGAVSPGTYCTRTYEECHRKPCRLQSPNYPGMYPRNVTCYWSLRQKDIPTCKHAMISVRQEHAHKMQIKRSISMASLNKTGRSVRAWRACGGERDRVIVYDGATTDDPVLLTLCGGDWLPAVTARGPEMLVAFHSSPYSAPLRPAPRQGFELDVSVVFVDSDSLDYAREARRCEFHVKASSSEEDADPALAGAGGAGGRGRRGKLRAPAHTLPPNTTCTWTFHGRPDDLVWIYFSSFTQYSLVESKRPESGERDEEMGSSAAPTALSTLPPDAGPGEPGAGPCAVQLRIWDGGGEVLGDYCDSPPRLCARASLANATRAPRPCAPPDGYVSRSAGLALSATTRPGTATHPLAFQLHYEFIDARLPGTALTGVGAVPVDCARELTSPGPLVSPRNALWFGRGGARRLRCVYRLRTPGDGGVLLKLDSATLGADPRCSSRPDPLTGRLMCVPESPDTSDADAEHETEPNDPDDDEDANDPPLRVPHLMIYESPWPGIRVPVACLCDNSSAVGLTVRVRGSLELRLSARKLRAREDQRTLQFRGSWSALPAPAPPCARQRRMPPPGAHVRLAYPYNLERSSECESSPFLLTARGNRSVFLRVWGTALTAGAGGGVQGAVVQGVTDEPICHTRNRVLVYDLQERLVQAICPEETQVESRTVQVFSAEWWGSGAGTGVGGGAALLVVWAASEPGAAAFSWMEVWRAPTHRLQEEATVPGAPGAASTGNWSAWCGAGACGTLAACMPPALWCDGAADCPGGEDEASAGCGTAARLLAALRGWRGGGAAGAGGALALALLALGLAAWRRRRGRGAGRGGGKLPARRLTEELLVESRTSSLGS